MDKKCPTKGALFNSFAVVLMLWIISFSCEYKVLFAIQWSHRISVNLFCVNWCPIATAAGGACLASSCSFASVFAQSQQHHVMTSIWIKIPHQNGNEMKGRKTISKKNEQEFRWISGKCLLCCHNANYTQIYMHTLRVFWMLLFYVKHCRPFISFASFAYALLSDWNC